MIDGRRVLDKTRMSRYEGIGLGNPGRLQRRPGFRRVPHTREATPFCGDRPWSLSRQKLERGWVPTWGRSEGRPRLLRPAWCRREFEARGLAPISSRTISRTARAEAVFAGCITRLRRARRPSSSAASGRHGDLSSTRPDAPTYRSGRRRADGPIAGSCTSRGFCPRYQNSRERHEVFYTCAVLLAGAERGIRWNDPLVAIAWPEPAAHSVGKGPGVAGFPTGALASEGRLLTA